MNSLKFAVAVALLTSCGQRNGESARNRPEHKPLAEPEIVHENISYRIDSFPDKAAVDSFTGALKEQDLKVLLDFNRLDRKFLKPGVKLVIPSTIFQSYQSYSTFPTELDFADTIQKLALVSLRNQSFALYEFGFLVRTGPCSSGKDGAPTPAGLYHTNWKKKVKRSTVDKEWIMPWYFNIANKAGIAFHEYELPGYAASHSCIRLHEADAIWIYNWAKSWKLADEGKTIISNGTPVVLFGNYDHSSLPAWFSLPENPHALDLTPEDLAEIQTWLQKRDPVKG